jgi:hypothetical protein
MEDLCRFWFPSSSGGGTKVCAAIHPFIAWFVKGDSSLWNDIAISAGRAKRDDMGGGGKREMKTNFLIRYGLEWMVVCSLLVLSTGCNKPATQSAEKQAPSSVGQQTPNDQQILGNIQSRVQSERALNGQQIEVSVTGGVATLSGHVDSEASRALAAADSGAVDGVRTVINDLEVPAPKAVEPVGAARKAPKPGRKLVAKALPPPPPPPVAAAPPPPPPPPAQEAVQIVAPPPPPPPPVVKTVTLPAGIVVPVRLTDALNSSVTQPDTVFHGSLAADLVVDGMIAAPRGASVIGRVVDVKDAGHFSGSAKISLTLTKLTAEGQELTLVTDTYTQDAAGRGKNTAMKAGGGAALGALIGALAGGGKGAAIGAATGGGIGAGSNGITRGKQVQIPSETLVNFNLQTPVSVRTSKVAGQSSSNTNDEVPVLKRAPQQ